MDHSEVPSQEWEKQDGVEAATKSVDVFVIIIIKREMFSYVFMFV